ncbi:hypothetical protein C943_03382 [Mariniradius saccharolyticus AK6]|uniref:Uncharacterized protein n=1 Tax=Mariniradius saccharolyticus AK6 TaxID=1239962 RepID=M7XB87_9BACT|nr:hypothetical protein [Mariniradius saccharolyticus]EMS34695.1 hypothetical protein C943_03382 [Mariniradius saccharolyticus AK6]
MSFGFSRVKAPFALAFVIITHIWLGNPTQSFAQKFSAEDLEMQIAAEIVDRNWARVLELARTQIWLDVDKAAGYYYSALAHMEIGNSKMAKPFLSEAKRLDDGELETQIAALEESLWDKKKKSSQSGFIPIRSMDRFYYALTYSPDMPFGFHLGSLNTHGIGTYFLIRTNQAFLQNKAEFTVNNSGTVYGSPYAKTEATGQVKSGMVELVMGLTWKLFAPVWMYGGVGLNHSREYWEMEILDENSNNIGNVWARNQQSNLNQPTLETGLMGDFKGLNVRVGTSLTSLELKQVRFHVGLGFSVRKK